MNIETLSERKLEDLYNKRFRDDAAQSQVCIAAGMGNWTSRQRDEALRGQSPATDAQLAICRDWLASSVAFMEVCDERARRKQYHGSRLPNPPRSIRLTPPDGGAIRREAGASAN